jgi:hypothetical protein
MNDHQASIVDESIVMEEALGNSKTYKSACNLFYINKHIEDQIKKIEHPIFSEEYANTI